VFLFDYLSSSPLEKSYQFFLPLTNFTHIIYDNYPLWVKKIDRNSWMDSYVNNFLRPLMTTERKVQNAMDIVDTALSKGGYTLYDYQEEGVAWMLGRELNTNTGSFFENGGILADDPGMGKTIQTAGLILGNPGGKTLIVVPLSIMHQWITELKKFIPGVRIRLNHGRSAAFKRKIDVMGKGPAGDYDICVTPYSSVFGTNEEGEYQDTILHSITWDRIVLDEGHIIRNRSTKVHKGCCKIKAPYRWVLTGTPIQNKKSDIQSLFRFLGIPFSYMTLNHAQIKMDFLKRRTRHIEEVKDKYTHLDVEQVDVPFNDPEELKFYQDVREECRKAFLRIKHADDGANHMMELFELILRLRQAAIHPNLVINGLAKKYGNKNPTLWTKSSAKLTKMVEMFATHVPETKTLIVCHYTDEINLVIGELGKAYPHLRIAKFDGSVGTDQRNDIIQEAANGEVDVMVIQIVCGSVGLNLQMFNKMYIFSPDWNPANEIQAIARIHRIGQTKPIHVVKFVATEPDSEDPEITPAATIDQRMIQIQIGKREIMGNELDEDTIRSNGRGSGGGLTMRDYTKIFSR
jgi:SNF2 family DNA or RNA helicase